MSCLYCGSDNCGGSGGGPTMCNDHPDNMSPAVTKPLTEPPYWLGMTDDDDDEEG